MGLRRPLYRVHIWLGWLVAIPVLLWTVSGLFMASFPIEQIRGEHLRRAAPALRGERLVAPVLGARPVTSLSAEAQALGVRWIISYQDGTIARADGRTGAPVGAVDAAEARAIAAASYAGAATAAAVTAFAAADNPLDLRRDRPAWQIRYGDGTHLYIDRESGRVLAVRTPLWRAFDFMWGLHILDPGGRENTHHPLLYGLAAVSVVMVALGAALLPMTLRRRRKRQSQ